MDELSPQPTRGRAAVSNLGSRFEREQRVRIDDGWGCDGGLPEKLRTIVMADAARSIISRNDSPDIPFDSSVNPYRGCEHGCVYCFARPTHAYLGLSPGLDFETKLFAKRDAAALLARELRSRSYVCRTLALGANTDPYQPVEREEGITREILSVCRDFNQPVSIITKSANVLRDLDILAPMAADGLAHVAMSITSLDRDLARTMEPRASTPGKRLEAVRTLTGAGVPVAVLTSPMIPALNDHEMEAILEAAADAGATAASYILLRLPLEIADLFGEWLRTHYPDRAERVLSLIRQSRDGALYRSEFGTRMKGTGAYADLLRSRFRLAIKRLGLDRRRWEMDCSKFRVPAAPVRQLSLF
ncbi:PA0069 family radical SAM protein [Niveispirillum sp. KHB5.9]|uniref:PA0069 family radical SAM protein n=1 Tax=Niveispirillum sp. KHB5.9 TaxID=3400269 RepID=UPI003A8C22A0